MVPATNYTYHIWMKWYLIRYHGTNSTSQQADKRLRQVILPEKVFRGGNINMSFYMYLSHYCDCMYKNV